MGRHGGDGPSCLSSKFYWLSPVSRLTKVYFTTENACRARKPPARGVFLAPFLDTGPRRTRKDAPCSAPFLHPHPTSLTHVAAHHTPVSRTLVYFRDQRLSTSTTHAEHENTPVLVSFRCRRLSYTTLSMKTRCLSCTMPTTKTHPLVGFRVRRLLYTLMCGERRLPSPSFLLSITASSLNIHSLCYFLYFIEYTFIVLLLISNTINLNKLY